MAELYWIHLEEHDDMTTQGYVGFTSRTTEIRYRTHVTDSKRDKYSHLPVYRAFAKYGDRLIVETLLIGTEDYCLFMENRLRPLPRTGWNVNVGGEKGSLGTKRSKESCEKQANTMRGVKRKESHCANLSKSLIGKRKSAAHCLAMSLYNKTLNPWENGRANKGMWARSEDFFNAYQEDTSKGAWALGKVFDLPMVKVAKIHGKIRDGWNPSTDEAFQLWLSQHKQKEALIAA